MEEQPIGCRLFFLFCQRDQELFKCVQLIEALDEYVLVQEEKALTSALKIFQDFLEPEVQPCVFRAGLCTDLDHFVVQLANRVHCVRLEEAATVKTKLTASESPKTLFEKCRQ